MLRHVSKKQRLEIFAPIEGKIVPLKDVPDPVFSERMMGEGIAIMPVKGNVFAPVEGTVILVAETKHAISIRANDGTELFIHIGLETVSLKGQGLSSCVAVGDEVTIGQLLVEVDWTYLQEHAQSIITPIVITNRKDKNIHLEMAEQSLVGKTLLMTVTAK